MRFIAFLLMSFCMLLPSYSNAETAPETSSSLTILTIGDSRVEGATPDFESYRFHLWKMLTEASFSVNMIGPLKDPGHYPKLGSLSFDPDHAGVGGFKTTDVLKHLHVVLDSEEMPDVILVGIGGNDLIESKRRPERIFKNVLTIVERLQDAFPESDILVEQIAPAKSNLMQNDLRKRFDRFNALVGQTIAQQGTEISQVFSVDMSLGWSDDYLADAVHYNDKGAVFIASKYFVKIQNLNSR